MPNQFNNRMDVEELAGYMARGKAASAIRAYADQCDAKPGLCLIPNDSPYVFMRMLGRTRKFSVKALVYYALRGTAPAFAPCPCKNKGCINPHHQIEVK